MVRYLGSGDPVFYIHDDMERAEALMRVPLRTLLLPLLMMPTGIVTFRPGGLIRYSRMGRTFPAALRLT